MDVDNEKVHHVVSGGLKHNKYYKVFATQVNTNGVESPYSEPSLIRVGDITPPPVPKLSIDKRVYKSGCHAVGMTCDVYFMWETPACDDLASYTVYLWKNRPTWYKGDKTYSKDNCASADQTYLISASDTSTSVSGQTPGNYIYVGIQAIDISHNRSDIAIIQILVEDTTALIKPTEVIHAAPYSIWAIRTWVRCPNYDYIRAVEIFRDGEDSIAQLLFIPGTTVEFIDSLSVMNGLTHFYTYRYVTEDGRTSPMSDPSKSATAEVIDLRYINQAKMKDFADAWANTAGIKAIENLQKTANDELTRTKNLAAELEKTTKNYTEAYNNYTRVVNQFEQLSASVKQDGETLKAFRTSIEQSSKAIALKATKTEVNSLTGKINTLIENKFSVTQSGITSTATKITGLETRAGNVEKQLNTNKTALQTQITQNANAIKLRATKSDIDTVANQVKQQLVSQINIQADRITTLVSEQEGTKSQITQLVDAIQMYVTKDGLEAMIAIAIQDGISIATLTANRIVITGEMLFNNNARLVGRLSANYLGIVDKGGKLVWGSDVGVLKPQVITGKQGQTFTVSGNRDQWSEMTRVPFTPQPPVNFNGQSRVNISVKFYIEVELCDPWCKSQAHSAKDVGVRHLGALRLDLADGNLLGTNAGTPAYVINGNCVQKMERSNQYRLDYVSLKDDKGRVIEWKKVTDRVWRSSAPVTIESNLSVPIGKSVYAGLFCALYSGDSSRTGNKWFNRISAINPEWRAECC